jgi:hypothetical protein
MMNDIYALKNGGSKNDNGSRGREGRCPIVPATLRSPPTGLLY